MKILEQEVLGCFLKDNTLLKETVIQINQFQEESSKLLFQSMLKLSEEGKAIDQVTLMADNYEYIQQMGGPDFITKLESTGNIENFESYERAFIDDYKKRESVRIAKEWLATDETNDTLITELQQLDDLNLAERQEKEETLRQIAQEPYMEVDKTGITTGLTDLDNILGGFQNKLSYIMGARPSMGKTATMLKLALSAAESGNVPLMFSLEMAEKGLVKRLIATIGHINLFLTKNPRQLSDSHKEKWKQAINQLYAMDYEIYDKPMQTIPYIRSEIRKAKRKYEGKQIIVLIDYLTLIHQTGRYHSDHAKVSDISARLKAIAKEYDCPVVTLAQLSRGVEQRQDKRPMLSDLRESGSIEQDADAVMFLYRDSYYNKEQDDNQLEIIVAKHRDGPTGTATVYYNKATGKMANLSADQRTF